MSTVEKTKINQLLSTTPPGVVLLTSWLVSHGYSSELIKRYKASGWLESIGTGALIRAGDKVDCYGGVYALQAYGRFNIHVGGRSAFSLLGKAHYLELAAKRLILFGALSSKLPKWFEQHEWKMQIVLHSTDFMPPEIGLTEVSTGHYSIKVSNEIRALMECLYLAPDKQDLTECYELMESMNAVNPRMVQQLLDHCKSIKVKRLFLYMAERIGHDWFNYLDLSKVNLGTGKRSIVKNGALDRKYQITIPKSWRNNDEGEVPKTS